MTLKLLKSIFATRESIAPFAEFYGLSEKDAVESEDCWTLTRTEAAAMPERLRHFGQLSTEEQGQVRELAGYIKSIERDHVGGMASTLTTDRHLELVLPKSFEKWLPIFRQHPVMLLGHDSNASRTLPIGRFERIAIKEEGLEVDGTMLKEHPQYAAVRAAVEAGLMMWSIGFIGKKGRQPYEEEVAKHGDGLQWVWEEVELLEISLVTIGSNRHTLAAMKALAARAARADLVDADMVEIMKSIRAMSAGAARQLKRARFGRKEMNAHIGTIMAAANTFVEALQTGLNAILDELPGDEEDPAADPEQDPAAPPAAKPGDEEEGKGIVDLLTKTTAGVQKALGDPKEG